VAEASGAASPQTTVIRPRSRGRSERTLHRSVGDWLAVGLLALLGLGSGVSVIADGFYDLTVWGPITIGMAALALAAAAVTAVKPRLAPALAVAGLTGMWLWSWLSASWAESEDQALLTAGRWALYAAMLTALLLLARTERDRWIPLIFATIGVLVAAGWVLVHMLQGDADALFFAGRLRDPLGYVNGQAGYFLLGFWPCVALAEQERSKVLAGVGAACALVLGSLLVLSQTRGVLPAAAASALVVLALVPGRPRRIFALAAIGLGLLAISAPLLDIYQNVPKGQSSADPELVKFAARRILLAALVVGVGWGLVQMVLARVASGGSPAGAWLQRGERFVAAGLVVLALLAAIVAVGDPVDKVNQQYDDFVNLRTQGQGDSSRFLSGGGYRYDYWRVAWIEFKDAPLIGQGAGNYDDLYFTERRTSEDIRQPHSIEMQTLAELGLVGMVFLLVFAGGVAMGLWHQSRRALERPERRIVAVAAGGAFVAWLAHTSVDWLHNIPGVTGVALCAALALLAPWARRRGVKPSSRIVAVALVAVLAVLAADSVGRLAYADKDRIDARAALRTDPVEALRLANHGLALNDQSVPLMYLKSAAYARLGLYQPARQTLLEAVDLEPSDHLTWALLGDLAGRRGDFRLARRYYLRSLALNPHNDFVRSLAKNPRSALENAP
jgi:tetratricopeptide (TPR) repeat protein